MLFRAFLSLAAVSVFLGLLAAQPRIGAAEPYFQGPKVCSECHKSEYEVWEGTKHFKSFRTVHKSDNARPGLPVKAAMARLPIGSMFTTTTAAPT